MQSEILLMINKIVKDHDNLKANIKRTPFQPFLKLKSFDISNNLLEFLLHMWDAKTCAFTKSNGECIPFNLAGVQDLLPFDNNRGVIFIELFEGSLPKDQGHCIMTNYLESQNTLKDAVSLFEEELKGERPNIEIQCRLYIIILWSSFLFPISSKGIYLNFAKLLDNLETLKNISWSKLVYDFLIWGLNDASSSLKKKEG